MRRVKSWGLRNIEGQVLFGLEDVEGKFQKSNSTEVIFGGGLWEGVLLVMCEVAISFVDCEVKRSFIGLNFLGIPCGQFHLTQYFTLSKKFDNCKNVHHGNISSPFCYLITM